MCLSMIVRVCMLAPYTSEEDDDEVNPRDKKQVGFGRHVVAAC